MSIETLDCGHGHDQGMPATVQRKDGTFETVQGWTFVLSLDGKLKLCHSCAALQILDCGHALGMHTGCAAGYGTDPVTGSRNCYECCAGRARAGMIETGRATLYIVARRGAPDPALPALETPHWYVTDWPGTLKFGVTRMTRNRHGGGFGSQRTDAWFVGPDGFVWHAVNRGDSDIARCKRTKERT